MQAAQNWLDVAFHIHISFLAGNLLLNFSISLNYALNRTQRHTQKHIHTRIYHSHISLQTKNNLPFAIHFLAIH